MIPSDHFVRYYNEVFKALEERGLEHLEKYWDAVGEMQKKELTEHFRNGRLQACYDYWNRILKEENCQGHLTLTEDYFEFRMERCPSSSKVLDNDAKACKFYCDHCMGWIRPVIDSVGMYAVMDLESRTEPHCVFRVYEDKKKAQEYERQVSLPSLPAGFGSTRPM